MDEYFAYFVEQYGKPADAEPFSIEDARKLRGRLPDSLLEFWIECGIGSWLDGKLQFSHPDTYASVVRTILKGDEQFVPDKTHLYGFGAFGELKLWNEDLDTISIDLPYLRAYAAATDPDWLKHNDDAAIVATFAGLDRPGKLSLFEDTPSTPPMFKKCVKAHGRLERGECFGLFPALALGGLSTVANTKRVRALEHFAMLAQLGPVRLTVPHASGDISVIRTLGGQD